MYTISGYNIRGGNLRNNGMYEDPKSIKNEFDRNCVSQQPFYFHVHFIFIIKCSRSLLMFFIPNLRVVVVIKFILIKKTVR